MFFKLYQYCLNLDNAQYFDLQPVKILEVDVQNNGLLVNLNTGKLIYRILKGSMYKKL